MFEMGILNVFNEPRSIHERIWVAAAFPFALHWSSQTVK